MNTLGEQSPYGKQEFWKAYSRLLYCSPANLRQARLNPDGSSTSRTLEAMLDSWLRRHLSSGRTDIRVLCLGMGAGTFDLPLLRLLDEGRRAFAPHIPLRVLGLDREAAPLLAAHHCFANLDTKEFPQDASAFAESLEQPGRIWPTCEKCKPCTDQRITVPELIAEDWTAWDGPWVSRTEDGQAMFSACVGDVDLLQLDGKEAELDPADRRRHILETMPSDWANHLRARIGTAAASDGVFDIVISAFCLHHLFWRRVVAIQSASLLMPGGVLMFGSLVRSDAQAFEGLPPDDSRRPLARICEGLLDALPDRQGFISDHLGRIGAHQQIEIVDLLTRAGLSHEDYRLSYQNAADVEIYADLIRVRGLSPLRDLDLALGPERNGAPGRRIDSCAARVLDELRSEGQTSDQFSSEVVWRVFERPSQRKASDEQGGVTGKFLLGRRRPGQASPVPRGRKTEPQSIGCNEYELSEAHVQSSQSVLRRTAEDRQQSVGHLFTAGVQAGVWHSGVALGAVGVGARQRGGLENYYIFYNPLARTNRMPYDTKSREGICSQVASLMAYVLLGQISIPTRGYSNSATLLKDVLPKFPMPAVFRYRFHDPHEHAFRVEAHRHRTFIELSLYAPGQVNFDSVNWGADGKLSNEVWHQWPEGALESQSLLLTAPKAPFKDGFPRTLLGPYVRAEVEHWLDAAGQTRRPEDEFLTSFRNACLPFLGELQADEVSHSLRRGSPDGKSKARSMVETMLALARMSSADEMVIYPAVTWDSAQGKFVADDSCIMVYDQCHLDDMALQHEFAKIDAIYQGLGLQKSADDAFDQLERVLGHELSKVYLGALDALRSIRSGDSQTVFATNAAVSALSYGELWSYSSESPPVDVRPIGGTNTGILWSDYAKAVLTHSWRTFVGAVVVFDQAQTIVGSGLTQRVNDLWSRDVTHCLRDQRGTDRFISWVGDSGGSDKYARALFRWFMVGLTNTWKHIVFPDRGADASVEKRILAAEAFLNRSSGILHLGGTATDGGTEFSIENSYDAVADPPLATEEKHAKTWLALKVAARELSDALGVSGHRLTFREVEGKKIWCTALFVPKELIAELQTSSSAEE